MEWMNELGNMDNVIHNICIKDSNLIVYIKLWNEEIKQDILDSDGSVDEISNVWDIVFCDAWNETILLEVLAEDMNVKSLNTKD